MDNVGNHYGAVMNRVSLPRENLSYECVWVYYVYVVFGYGILC